MTRIDVNGSDSTTTHLFRLDLPDEAVERFTTMAGTGEWPLKYALGAEKLRPGFVDVVKIGDLGAMPLSQYLSEAYALGPKALGADTARIDALQGHAVILPPQAFDNHSQTLTVATPLSHVGSYGGPKPATGGAPLRSEAAKGAPTGGAPAAPGRGSSGLLKLIAVGVGIVILLTIAMILR